MKTNKKTASKRIGEINPNIRIYASYRKDGSIQPSITARNFAVAVIKRYGDDIKFRYFHFGVCRGWGLNEKTACMQWYKAKAEISG
jgi:hypothetical protein